MCMQEGTICVSLSVTLYVRERKRGGKRGSVGQVAFIFFNHISELVLPFLCLSVLRSLSLSSCFCSTTFLFPPALSLVSACYTPPLPISASRLFFIVKQHVSSSPLPSSISLRSPPSLFTPLHASFSLPPSLAPHPPPLLPHYYPLPNSAHLTLPCSFSLMAWGALIARS